MKKSIIIIIVIAILVGGYFYYSKRLQPSLFVSSFCEILEYEGTDSFKLRDYLLSAYDVTPLQSWEEMYLKSKEENDNLSKEQLFKIWKDVYLSRFSDYVDVSLEFPQINIMTKEMFKKVYKEFSFSNFSINYKDYENDQLKASGYVEIKYKGSTLGNVMFGGKRKFDLIVQNGSLGWKVIIFSLDY